MKYQHRIYGIVIGIYELNLNINYYIDLINYTIDNFVTIIRCHIT